MVTAPGPQATPKAPRDGFGLVGTTVGTKYLIESVIGEGGYGIVYAARHLLIGKPVALKCMKPLGTSAADSARATGLFLREAQVLFSMSHPGIVRLYDVGTLTVGLHDEVPYAVLELVEGRSLEQEIDARAAEQRPFTRDELERIFVGVLEALAFTHAAGIAHRDLKPSNIMLVATPEGFRPKVLDFGVARFVAQDTKQSTGLTGFTPAYAAPEQWTDGLGSPGAATDVFSLALTFAEACTLQTVMEARTPAQIFGVVMAKGRKVTLPQRDDLPSGLQLVLDRALQVEPRLRYPTAREMLDDIKSAFATNSVSAEAQVLPNDVTQAAPLLGREPGPDPNVATAPSTLRMPPQHGPSGTPSAAPSWSSPPAARPPVAPPSPPARGGAIWGFVGGALVLLLVVVGAGLAFALRAFRAAAVVAVAPSATSSPQDPSPPSREIHVTAVATGAGAQYTAEQLTGAVLAARDELRQCHRTAVAGGAPGIADVALFVTIRPSGAVVSVTDLDDIAPLAKKLEPRTHECVAGIAKEWRFPSNTKEDLAGALVTVRLREVAPDTTPLPEPVPQAYDSVWAVDKGRQVTPSYKLQTKTIGRVMTIDYKDGTGACVEYNNKLSCRWAQLDSHGGMTFERKPGGVLDGRWGFREDDRGEGTWKLTPTGAAAAPKPKTKPPAP